MSDRTCSHPGCDSPHRARGLCNKHYLRLIKGRPLDDPKPRSDAERQEARRTSQARYKDAHRVELRARARARYARNAETERERNRRWHAANAAKVSETNRRWRAANPERYRTATLAWIAANPEKARANWARKRARRLDLTTNTTVDYEAVLVEHGLWCHICGYDIADGDLHFDHVIPLSRGGSHSAANIRPAHAACNLRKGAKIVASAQRRHELAPEEHLLVRANAG